VPTASPPPSLRTHAPTAQLDTPSLTSLPQARLSVLSRSFPDKKSLSARFLFSLPVSLSQLVRRMHQRVEMRESMVRVRVAVSPLVVDVAEDVVAEPVALVNPVV